MTRVLLNCPNRLLLSTVGFIFVILLPWRMRMAETSNFGEGSLGVMASLSQVKDPTSAILAQNIETSTEQADSTSGSSTPSTTADKITHGTTKFLPLVTMATRSPGSQSSRHPSVLAVNGHSWRKRFPRHHESLPEYDPNKNNHENNNTTGDDAVSDKDRIWGWNVPGVPKIFYTHGIGPSFGVPLKLPTPVLVVGMPKSGTSSIRDFFRCNGHNASHWRCVGSDSNTNAFCAHTIRHNIIAGRPALFDTGNYHVYAQMDVELPSNTNFTKEDVCYMPQVKNLDKLHESHPNATFLLNRRNVTTWIDSLRHFMRFDDRLRDCNLTDFPPGMGETDAELETFYHSHLNNIREFVKRHPGHALVEFDIEASTAGSVLADAFGLQEECWVKRNARPRAVLRAEDEGREMPDSKVDA